MASHPKATPSDIDNILGQYLHLAGSTVTEEDVKLLKEEARAKKNTKWPSALKLANRALLEAYSYLASQKDGTEFTSVFKQHEMAKTVVAELLEQLQTEKKACIELKKRLAAQEKKAAEESAKAELLAKEANALKEGAVKEKKATSAQDIATAVKAALADDFEQCAKRARAGALTKADLEQVIKARPLPQKKPAAAAPRAKAAGGLPVRPAGVDSDDDADGADEVELRDNVMDMPDEDEDNEDDNESKAPTKKPPAKRTKKLPEFELADGAEQERTKLDKHVQQATETFDTKVATGPMRSKPKPKPKKQETQHAPPPPQPERDDEGEAEMDDEDEEEEKQETQAAAEPQPAKTLGTATQGVEYMAAFDAEMQFI